MGSFATLLPKGLREEGFLLVEIKYNMPKVGITLQNLVKLL